MNYWYVSRDNEILIDMDRPSTSIPHAEDRLNGAISSRTLDIVSVEIHDSFTAEHIHMMITLRSPMSPIERMVWALMLRSDIYRGCSSIMRRLHGISASDLIITPIPFEREYDSVCHCESKHKADVMDICPTAIRLRGNERLRSFFSVPMEHGEQIISKYQRGTDSGNYIWFNPMKR